eukprot:366548-Chlamydomonas_euryale.AAC.13
MTRTPHAHVQTPPSRPLAVSCCPMRQPHAGQPLPAAIQGPPFGAVRVLPMGRNQLAYPDRTSDRWSAYVALNMCVELSEDAQLQIN